MATSVASHNRTEPQFFNVYDLPWREHNDHEAVHGLESRLAARDEASGSATYLTRFPAGLKRTLTAETENLECFVLEGDLTVHGKSVRSGGFLAVPRGCGPVTIESHGGAVAYVFSNPEILLPSYSAGIHVTNVWQQEWHASTLTNVRHGIAGKSLRVPDVRGTASIGGPSGFLRMTMMPAGFVEPRTEVHHSCWEEIILLAGDMIMADRGRMAPGSYLGNPANLWHYPAASQRGCLMLLQCDAPMDVRFKTYPGGFEYLANYVETCSFCEPPVHETFDSERAFDWAESETDDAE